MKLLKLNDTITVGELQQMSAKMFEKIVKAVVDVEKQIMVVDAAMQKMIKSIVYKFVGSL